MTHADSPNIVFELSECNCIAGINFVTVTWLNNDAILRSSTTEHHGGVDEWVSADDYTLRGQCMIDR